MLPSPLWSSSLLRLLDPHYIQITVLRNVGNYQSSWRNTPEDMNLVSHYPSIFLSPFLLFLLYLQYSVRPVSMSQLSFAGLHVSVQWRLLVNSVTVLFLPRRLLYRWVSGFVFRKYMSCRSQWRRGLRRRSAAARLLRSWVRIPPGAWIFVCCECSVLSGRGLCDELITRPEESYRLCCVVVCDLETSRMGAPYIYMTLVA